MNDALRLLTELLHQQGHTVSAGLLGGEYGYGCAYEDEHMMMHPFCWCGEEDCLWCEESEEIAPNFHHKKTGFKVRWYKYIGRSMEIEGQCDWPEILAECLASIRLAEATGVEDGD